MTKFTIRDYKMTIIKRDYVRYADLLFNFQNHIELCYNECILTLSDRNQILNQLDDIIKTISNIYNSYITEYDDNEDNIISDTEITLESFSVQDIDDVYNNIQYLIPLYKQIDSGFQSLVFEPYKEINKNLSFLAQKYGTFTFTDSLFLSLGVSFDNYLSDDFGNILNFCNKFLFPIKFKIIDLDNNHDNNIDFNKIIFKKMVDKDNSILGSLEKEIVSTSLILDSSKKQGSSGSQISNSTNNLMNEIVMDNLIEVIITMGKKNSYLNPVKNMIMLMSLSVHHRFVIISFLKKEKN